MKLKLFHRKEKNNWKTSERMLCDKLFIIYLFIFCNGRYLVFLKLFYIVIKDKNDSIIFKYLKIRKQVPILLVS